MNHGSEPLPGNGARPRPGSQSRLSQALRFSSAEVENQTSAEWNWRSGPTCWTWISTTVRFGPSVSKDRCQLAGHNPLDP